jgi:hypothetical protein
MILSCHRIRATYHGIIMGRVVTVFLLALIVGVPAAIAFMGIQKEALVSKPGEINFTDYERAQKLAERYDPRRMPPEQITTVQATSDELNTLLKGAFGGIKQIATRVKVSRFGVIAALTAELPIPASPLGRFVNIRTVIAPSQDGLEFTRFAVGSMELPPSFIRPALLFGLNRMVGEEHGQRFLDSVRSVRVAEPEVSIAFKPPAGMVDTIKAAAKQHASLSNPTSVRRYYEVIDDVMSDIPRGRQVSLTEIIRPVFQLAQRRSQKLDPVRENEAALLAIAIYFGDTRFERLVGKIRSEESTHQHRLLDHVRLNGRHDFVQHFTISIGLTLTGGDLAANMIGEFKEAKDSQGSSGFSFTDIGADRAGVLLAKRAVSRPSTAFKIQRILANSHSEKVFFPGFTDLPEGLSTAAFRQRYGDVNSREYKRVIAEIDKRIYRTRLFR